MVFGIQFGSGSTERAVGSKMVNAWIGMVDGRNPVTS